MVIMLVFLLLSGLAIVGTAVYLNKKKKSINGSMKTTPTNITNDNNKHKNKSKKKLSNILQIKVKDNIICLGNRYSCIIRLGNIDYNMLSNNEQESIENVLIQTALSIDYPIQFFSTTEYIDTSKIIALIKKNKTKNLKVQEYKQYLINYLDSLMENRAISVVKNYAVISYDGLYEDALEELNRKASSFKGNLLRAKIVCETLNENELYDLIYRELNKNSALSISKLQEGVKNLYVGKKQERYKSKKQYKRQDKEQSRKRN